MLIVHCTLLHASESSKQFCSIIGLSYFVTGGLAGNGPTKGYDSSSAGWELQLVILCMIFIY